MAIEIVDFPINSMVDLSIAMWQFTRGYTTPQIYPNLPDGKHGSLNVPIFHITQPLDSIIGINGLFYGYYFRWCPLYTQVMGHLTSPEENYDIWVWVKIRYPNNWMVNTKLDIHICGPLNGLPFWPTSISCVGQLHPHPGNKKPTPCVDFPRLRRAPHGHPGT